MLKIEHARYQQRIRYNNERVSAAKANFEEEKANNANAVADINHGNADTVRIKNDYLRKVLKWLMLGKSYFSNIKRMSALRQI